MLLTQSTWGPHTLNTQHSLHLDLHTHTLSKMGKNKKQRYGDGSGKRSRDESLNNSTLEGLKAQLLMLEGELFDIRTSHSTVLEEVKILRQQNIELKDSLQEQKHINNINRRNNNDIEQYTRRNNIRIFGVEDKNPKETSDESEQLVAKLCQNKLGYNLQPWEVEVAHRTGRFQVDGNRPIIVRLVSRKTRSGILSARRKLKGTSIVIAEDLTHENLRRFRQVRDLECVSQAWVRDGKIFAKNCEVKITEIKTTTIITEQLFSSPKSRSSQIPSFSVKAVTAPEKSSTETSTSTSPKMAKSTVVGEAGQSHQQQKHHQQKQPSMSQITSESPETVAGTPKSSTPIKQIDPKTYTQSKLVDVLKNKS